MRASRSRGLCLLLPLCRLLLLRLLRLCLLLLRRRLRLLLLCRLRLLLCLLGLLPLCRLLLCLLGPRRLLLRLLPRRGGSQIGSVMRLRQPPASAGVSRADHTDQAPGTRADHPSRLPGRRAVEVLSAACSAPRAAWS